MTLGESLTSAYQWAVDHRLWILIGALAWPVAGTLAARLGKGGKTDSDGRLIASAVVGVGLVSVMVEILAMFAAHSLLQRSLLDADVALLVAPPLCLAGCLVGIRWVFPLSELASVRTLTDVGAFVAACLGVIWLFSKFRGWGIVFFGGIAQMIAIGTFGLVLLRRLYRRAFGAPRA